MCASPHGNLSPDRLNAEVFVQKNPGLSQEEAVRTARDHYREWYADLYLGVLDLAPSFDKWSVVQDEEMRRQWGLLHPAV